MLQSLVVDGVIGGVGSFLIFLPQILVLFLFIALLGESKLCGPSRLFNGQIVSLVWP